MNNNWKVLPFGEVCELVGGSQPPKSEFIYEPREGFIRLVQVRDYKTDKYETYIPISKAKKFCNTTDIMIGRYGPPIFGVFSGIEGAYNVALMKAVPNESLLNRDYFRWFLKTHTLVKFVEKTSKRAAGQDGVRKERLYSYKVPIPPLEEQKQIVTILDDAFEAIDQAQANIEKNIENAKELFDSKKENLFDRLASESEVIPIEEACEKIFAGGDAPKENFSKVKTEEFFIPIIANAVKKNGLYGYTNEAKVIKPSITIAARGSGTGHTEYRDYPFVPIVRLIVLTPNDEVIDVEYLMHAIKSLTILRSGSAIPQLTVPMIKGYSIPVPSKLKQLDIVDTLNRLEITLESYISILNSKIISLEGLKKSILEKAFAGELTSKDMPA